MKLIYLYLALRSRSFFVRIPVETTRVNAGGAAIGHGPDIHKSAGSPGQERSARSFAGIERPDRKDEKDPGRSSARILRI